MIPQELAAYPYSPYCGPPVSPLGLGTRWNLDPLLLIGLVVCLSAYWVWSRRQPGVAMWRRLAFAIGWSVGGLALVSPLCALSVSLFSARVGQHMILACIAAPLIALGRPDGMFAGRKGSSARSADPHPLLAAVAFAGALWFWHAPGPYLAAFQSDGVYWLMHLTTFGAALWLWMALLGSRCPLASVAAAVGLTTAQMAVLGAAITFASRPLYAPHLATTAAWGLTPLEDQQLGGVLMWAPAGLILTLGLVLLFAQIMRRAEQRSLGRTLAG